MSRVTGDPHGLTQLGPWIPLLEQSRDDRLVPADVGVYGRVATENRPLAQRATELHLKNKNPQTTMKSPCAKEPERPFTTLKAPRPSELKPQSPLEGDSDVIQIPGDRKDKIIQSAGAWWLYLKFC